MEKKQESTKWFPGRGLERTVKKLKLKITATRPRLAHTENDFKEVRRHNRAHVILFVRL